MANDQQRRVLIVDDEQSVRRMLAAALRQQPLVVDEASDGAEAIQLLRENTYSVVLLDLMMPVSSGFDVLEAIASECTNEPVVLVVSGADRHMLLGLDANRIHGVVRKPFDPQEIAGIVAACTDLRSRSAFETMALATMIGGAPLIALLKL